MEVEEIITPDTKSIFREFYGKVRTLMPQGSKANGFPIMIGRHKLKVDILNPQSPFTKDSVREYVEIKLSHRTISGIVKIFHLYPRGAVKEYHSTNLSIEKICDYETVLFIVLQLKILGYKTSV